MKEHLVSKAYIDEDQTNYGGMIAEIYQLTTGEICYDIYDDKGRIIATGDRKEVKTIDQAKQLALEALKNFGWRIIEGKYAVML